MNDWTAETAKGYETMIQAQENFNAKMKAQFARLQAGMKILSHNAAHRRDEWATIAKVVTTTAHTGYVVTEKGKTIWASEIKLVHTKTETETLQICLNDRIGEFTAAVRRAEKSDLVVYADWEKDHFVVVNCTSGEEYRVALQTRDDRLFASCECLDFKQRSRVCKHQVAVVGETHPAEFALLAGRCPVCQTKSENGLTHWDCELIGKDGIKAAREEQEAWRYLNEVV